MTTAERLRRASKAPLLRGNVRVTREELAQAASELDALTRERDRLRKACQEVKSDFDRFSVCKSNTSDGEYTQDYTTRRERIEAALKGTTE